MLNRLKLLLIKSARRLFCHRAMYIGLSFSYGLACIGVTDKLVVNVLVTSIYLLMAWRG